MPAALAFLILIALTNYAVIFFSCWGLSKYGAWLNKYHKVDLWLHRLLVSWWMSSRFLFPTFTTHLSLFCFTDSKWCRHIRHMDNHSFLNQPKYCVSVWQRCVQFRLLHYLPFHFDCGVGCMVSGNDGRIKYWFQKEQAETMCPFFSQVHPGKLCPRQTREVYSLHLPCCDLGADRRVHKDLQSCCSHSQ